MQSDEAMCVQRLSFLAGPKPLFKQGGRVRLAEVQLGGGIGGVCQMACDECRVRGGRVCLQASAGARYPGRGAGVVETRPKNFSKL